MNIRDIIDMNAVPRRIAKEQIRQLIDTFSLKGPEGYGVIFEGFTMARYKPWEGKYPERGFGMSEDRMFMIEQFARIAPKGYAIECGVYTGYVTKMLLGIFDIVYAFDTFEGIKGAKSDELFADGDLSVADRQQEVFDRIIGANIVIGEVPQSLSSVNLYNVSFVHLDMDVYKPTIGALKHIYPCMVKGGIIMLDDYGNWLALGIKEAVDEFVQYYGVKFIYLPTGQGVIIK